MGNRATGAMLRCDRCGSPFATAMNILTVANVDCFRDRLVADHTASYALCTACAYDFANWVHAIRHERMGSR